MPYGLEPTHRDGDDSTRWRVLRVSMSICSCHGACVPLRPNESVAAACVYRPPIPSVRFHLPSPILLPRHVKGRSELLDERPRCIVFVFGESYGSGAAAYVHIPQYRPWTMPSPIAIYSVSLPDPAPTSQLVVTASPASVGSLSADSWARGGL